MEKECVPICRVCMENSPDFVAFDMPIQNENEAYSNITYSDFFFECTRIQVEPFEGASYCFCLPCGNILRSFYTFYKVAEISDCILKKKICLIPEENSQQINSTSPKIIQSEEQTNIICETNEEYDCINQPHEAVLTDSNGDSNSFQLEVLNDPKAVGDGSLVELNIDVYKELIEEISDNVVLTTGTEAENCPTIEFSTASDVENCSLIEFSPDSDVENCSNVELSISSEAGHCFTAAILASAPQITSEPKLKPNHDNSKNKKGIRKSDKKYKRGPVECAFCHDILKTQKLLDRHLIEEHQRRTKPCEICGKMVIRMRDHLLIHEREKQSIKRPKAECPVCFRMVSKQTLSRHVQQVHRHELRKEKCKECSQTFADAHKLKVHMLKGHHSKVNLKCPLCSRKFSNRISFNNHLRVHPCLERLQRL